MKLLHNTFVYREGDMILYVLITNNEEYQSNNIDELKATWSLHWQSANNVLKNMFYSNDDYVLLRKKSLQSSSYYMRPLY